MRSGPQKSKNTFDRKIEWAPESDSGPWFSFKASNTYEHFETVS